MKIIVSIVCVCCLLAWLYLSLDKEVVFKGDGIVILEDEIFEIKNNPDNQSTDEQILANIIEKKFFDQLLIEFEINSTFDAKLNYFNKYHPQTLSVDVFNNRMKYKQNLFDALESITNNSLNEDEAYKKYMSQNMSIKNWVLFLKTTKKQDMLNILKGQLSDTYALFTKEAIGLLDETYSQEVVSMNICKMDIVKNKLDSYIGKVNKDNFRKADYRDSMIENLRKSRCNKESKIWLRSYLEKKYILLNEDYLGFKKHISFYKVDPILDFLNVQ